MTLLLLALLGGVLLIPSLIKDASNQNDIVVSTVNCSLNKGACTYQSSIYGDITVLVTPNEFTPLIPLTIKVTTKNAPVQDATARVDGKDMFMGLNQTSLSRTANSDVWQGEITIPVCTVDKEMEWLLSLTLEGNDSERLVFNITSIH